MFVEYGSVHGAAVSFGRRPTFHPDAVAPLLEAFLLDFDGDGQAERRDGSLHRPGIDAGKKSIATTAGTFTTTSGIFVALLIGVILIIGALTFFPADALGPIVEHLQLYQGKTF